MGTGFTGGPGNGGGGTGVQPPDLELQAQQELLGKQNAGQMGIFARIAWFLTKVIVPGTLTGIATLWDGILLIIAKIAFYAQGTSSDVFYKLSAAVLGDLLGKEVEIPANAQVRPQNWDMDFNRIIGQNLFDVLSREFVQSGGLSEDQGQAAAATFLGFLISFGVRESNVALFADILPVGILEEFRKIGVNVARNLGLGRQARAALRPLIDVLVAQPLQWRLHSQYRPTLLAAPEATRAFIRGAIDEPTFRQTMARHGYADDLITALVEEHGVVRSPQDAVTLLNWGIVDKETALDYIKKTGAPDDVAGDLLISLQLKRAERAVNDILAEIRALVKDGFVDADGYRTLLDQLPISDDLKEKQRQVYATLLEFPRKRLTLAQMQKAYFNGIIDLTDWNEFLATEGYSQADQTILTYELLAASSIEQDKLKFAQLKQKIADNATVKKAIKEGLLPPGATGP